MRYKPIHPAACPQSVIDCYVKPIIGGSGPRDKGWWWMQPSCDRFKRYAVNYGGMFWVADTRGASEAQDR